MKVIAAENKPMIELGMKAATDRLVNGPNSPLLMGATVGLVYIGDGPEVGSHFVTDVQSSSDFDEKGFPKELWLAYADFLEELAAGIRSGTYDFFLEPHNEAADCEGSA